MTIDKKLIFSRAQVLEATPTEAEELRQALNKPSVIRYLERTIEINAMALLSEEVLREAEEKPLQFIKAMARTQGITTLAFTLLNFTEGDDNG